MKHYELTKVEKPLWRLTGEGTELLHYLARILEYLYERDWDSIEINEGHHICDVWREDRSWHVRMRTEDHWVYGSYPQRVSAVRAAFQALCCARYGSLAYTQGLQIHWKRLNRKEA